MTKAVFKTTGGGNHAVRETTASYAAGERIFAAGDLGVEMYIILDGEVDIIKYLHGEPHKLSHLEKGDFFGEMALLESAPRTADAVAVSDVRVLLINGSQFDEMLKKNPEIAVRIIRKYSQRLREANALLERITGPGVVDVDKTAFDRTAVSAPQIPIERMVSRRLVDVATGTAFFLSNGDETTIGRADPVTGILPDVDLTAVDTNRSVSRRHAKIIRSGDEFHVLEEVGTVNGTFVNDQRIPTGVPVTLHNGDLVKIGLIAMKAVFE